MVEISINRNKKAVDPAAATGRTAQTIQRPEEGLPRLPQPPANAASVPGVGRKHFGTQPRATIANREPVLPPPHPSGTMATSQPLGGQGVPSTGQRVANVAKGAFQGARAARQGNNTTY
ncbi:hypothetical protein FRC00_010707 [Tulasnella sp. 408]|nr:hypothetical protein FRC00_010707 [Tulasnella sp. 408]